MSPPGGLVPRDVDWAGAPVYAAGSPNTTKPFTDMEAAIFTSVGSAVAMVLHM